MGADLNLISGLMSLQYYSQLNIRIVLVGLEVFQTGNPFDVNGEARDVLSEFVLWRKNNLTSRVRNDMGQLVVYVCANISGS